MTTCRAVTKLQQTASGAAIKLELSNQGGDPMTHRNGCKAMQLAQEAWDMQVPEHEDDELQLEVDRVFEEVMTDGEAYCCGETITMEQVKFMAADDFALDERIAALALDPLDSDHAMSVQRSLMLAIEAIIKGLGDE